MDSEQRQIAGDLFYSWKWQQSFKQIGAVLHKEIAVKELQKKKGVPGCLNPASKVKSRI